MSGGKTKVVAATALGVLVLGCGCYFVFASGSDDMVQGVAGEIVSVARTPDPPANDKPRVQDNRRRGPQRPVEASGPRKPGRPNKRSGPGRRPPRPNGGKSKVKIEPNC